MARNAVGAMYAGKCFASLCRAQSAAKLNSLLRRRLAAFKMLKCVAAQLSKEDPGGLFRSERWQPAGCDIECLQCLLPALFPPKSEDASFPGISGIRWFDDAFAWTEPPSDEGKVQRRLQGLNKSLLAAWEELGCNAL